MKTFVRRNEPCSCFCTTACRYVPGTYSSIRVVGCCGLVWGVVACCGLARAAKRKRRMAKIRLPVCHIHTVLGMYQVPPLSYGLRGSDESCLDCGRIVSSSICLACVHTSRVNRARFIPPTEILTGAEHMPNAHCRHATTYDTYLVPIFLRGNCCEL